MNDFNLSDYNWNDWQRKRLKEFIRLLKKEIDICADKTDIWDNERWGKLRNFLKKSIDKLAGEGLV